MTSRTNTTATGWPRGRWLAGLAALVLTVHVLVLEVSPNLMGTTRDPTRAIARTFSTRTIEAALPKTENIPIARAAPRPPKTSLAKTAKNQPSLPSPRAETAPLGVNSPVVESVSNLDPSSAEISAPRASLNTPPSEPTAPPSIPPASSPAVAALSAAPVVLNTTAVTGMHLPGSVRLQFKVTGTSKGLNYFANADLAWLNSGNHYDASMKVSAFLIGSRSMTSAGLITPGGLAPTRFADKFKSELAAHFEVDKGKITFSANTPDAPWIEGAQDRVSVFIQLGGMLAGKPSDFPIGSSIALYTAGPRDADVWTFKVEAEETLQLPAGDMTTLKLTRAPRREYDQKVEIWYAPSLGYLPVRNRITQANGDFIDQQLTGVVKP